MKGADAGLAGRRWRTRPGARRERASPSTTGLDQLCLDCTTAVRRNVIAVARWSSRNRQRGPGILTIAPFLFLRVVLVRSVTRSVPRAGRHPVEIFLQVATTATTAASFERQIVTLLRPKILMTLPFGPASRAAAALQVREHRLLPSVETLAMHELADRAVIVVARHLDRVVQCVQSD